MNLDLKFYLGTYVLTFILLFFADFNRQCKVIPLKVTLVNSICIANTN